MAHHLSEEEQIEAFKNWWKENGSSLLTGVVIVLAVFFGSRQWQSAQTAKVEAASDLYESIVQLSLSELDSPTEESNAQLEGLYDQLRNDYGKSIYARYGALMMASVYIGRENYNQAAAELNWILDNPDLGFLRKTEEELFLVTRLRLARVRLAQGQAQEALDLVTAVDPGTLAAGYAEVQGDAYLQLDQRDQARSAYQRAVALGPDNASFIELKIQGIGE